ncbi:MAG TPA: sigma-70 family RNA polymerase sigma factor [Thermoanaerobaculia bacterium]|nr:sigma-70 family RNA polymerase sigma factor [Thermoanaerobaculia bacterium]
MTTTPARRAAVGAVEIHELLAAARPKLRRMLANFRVPLEDAEDVLHDALVALLRTWEQLDGVANREAWLLGTLRITIFQYWRARTRERRFLEQLSHELAASESAPQERQDSARDLEALTADLTERDFQILWVRYGLCLPPREAAELLGCRPDSVRKLCRRALERVRRRLPQPPPAAPARPAPAGPAPTHPAAASLAPGIPAASPVANPHAAPGHRP